MKGIFWCLFIIGGDGPDEILVLVVPFMLYKTIGKYIQNKKVSPVHQ
jgi:hypothetical protein